jgi:hypothetical protein
MKYWEAVVGGEYKKENNLKLSASLIGFNVESYIC